ncbi:MAG: 2,3-cyclic-nucleotide 2-phosphodiesterase [Petroclostridium sp.]|uniref:TIGR00282 family metallophosphoesterase n=1 Tax=Petroclostridium xylanilyticum TaxID=1792311 RepID=UPI000B9920A2|nr:TIGR00282 family metallophosphoesterase [Petroclostridium xylanilyticum]MBZ4646367.1 metallophosphoesterase [Clostridia bacterium]MDK2810188.1 2,3-cyclic-nucleotide 2-phosphodiesterase [Petroclostridium sp.]
MRVLAIGDIVGNSGRAMIKDFLGKVKKELEVDLCIANGENSAAGNGITRHIAYELFNHGVDVITMGNHVWSKKEIVRLFEENLKIIRPANYPPGTPGSGHIVVGVKNSKAAIVNISGRVYLENLDCPFRVIENELKLIKKITNIIIVDFHAEATSEKVAMGWYLDGKVSAVFGTHTHVQTADERILPKGTGYITDIGMTGPYDSILGVQKEIIINRFITHFPEKFEIADGPAQFNGIILEIDEVTGKTTSINRIVIK